MACSESFNACADEYVSFIKGEYDEDAFHIDYSKCVLCFLNGLWV